MLSDFYRGMVQSVNYAYEHGQLNTTQKQEIRRN